ncbi:cytochrome c maturation protein CcmE [Ponticaulis profundi]|uniref:Cytochrome c-type biogenesis protein CcmE n=1 Tax=Ponticaulis profundi TaxID=2665222 RepID=A0ABW1S5S1_9PROT
MRARTRRLWLVIVSGAILISAVSLTLFALRNQVALFYTPADLVAQGGGQIGERARIGGLVKEGTLEQLDSGDIRFVVEDGSGEIIVSYNGFVPDLFREGQGVVANGQFTEAWSFRADELLAKHDESYMPKELEDKLKEQGVFKGAVQ